MLKSALPKEYTNEKLKCLFKNNFELANFAIDIAKKHIETGHYKTLTEIINELKKISKNKNENS